MANPLFKYAPAIRVESTSSGLTVIDPPYVGLGLALVGVGVVSLLLWMGIAKSKGLSAKWGLWGLVTAIPFVLGGIGILTSSTRLTLSRASNEVQIDSRYFGLFGDIRKFPLTELHGARVETSEGNRSLVLLLTSGQTLGLTSFSDREGHYAAEKAINEMVLEPRASNEKPESPATAKESTMTYVARLELSVPLQRRVYGDHVECNVTLRNVTNRTLWVNRRMLVNAPSAPKSFKEVWFSVWDSKGTAVPFDCKVRAGNAPLESYGELKPEDTIGKDVILSDCFRFTKPGEYVVQAHFQDGSDFVPPPVGNRHLYELLDSNKVSVNVYKMSETSKTEFLRKAPNTRFEESSAVQAAENFIGRNGYTDAQPSKTELAHESIEYSSNTTDLLKVRQNSLESKAFGIVHQQKGGAPGWTVIFRYKNQPSKVAGRAVAMNLDGTNIRMVHQDYLLSKVETVFQK